MASKKGAIFLFINPRERFFEQKCVHDQSQTRVPLKSDTNIRKAKKIRYLILVDPFD